MDLGRPSINFDGVLDGFETQHRPILHRHRFMHCHLRLFLVHSKFEQNRHGSVFDERLPPR